VFAKQGKQQGNVIPLVEIRRGQKALDTFLFLLIEAANELIQIAAFHGLGKSSVVADDVQQVFCRNISTNKGT
jgi:hypothetical protein